MIVYPQEYKLNCIKIGFSRYNIRISIIKTSLAGYTDCNDDYSTCSVGMVVNGNFRTRKYTITVTWDGMTVSSGSIIRSITGDQMYQCVVEVTDQPTRIRSVTIEGNRCISILN